MTDPALGLRIAPALIAGPSRTGYQGVANSANLKLRDAPPAEERVLREVDVTERSAFLWPTGITPAQRQDLPITLDEEKAATPSVPRQPVEASSQRETLEPIDDEADRSSPLFW